MDDHELLRDYVEKRSEKAFRDLVERHLSMVYAAARRMARDADLAEEIAQDVFNTLAQKGKTIRPSQVIGGWLYNTTRHLAMHAVRREQRRRERELTAVAMQIDETNPAQEQIHESLEPAMAELNESERDALILRFLENRSLREVGAELGISEDAARMRVNRALEELRGVFSRRGVGVTSVLLVTALTAATSSAVPAGLTVSIAVTALATAATVTSTIIPTTITTMTWINTKTVIATIAAGLLAGTGTYLSQQSQMKRLRAERVTLLQETSRLAEEHKKTLQLSLTTAEDLQRLRQTQSELLRLRSEVGQLHHQIDESKKVKPATGKISKSAPLPAKEEENPGAYIAKDQIAFAGYATPEDACRSFTWATISGDYQTLTASMTPEFLEQLRPEVRQMFENGRVQEKMKKFNGMQVLAKKIVSPDTVELQIWTDNGSQDAHVQRMVKLGSDWKLGASIPYEPAWDQTGQIQRFAK